MISSGRWMTAGMLVLLCARTAAEVTLPNVYFSAGVGADYSRVGDLGAGRRAYFDLGRPVGRIAVGVDRPGNLRFELEGSYRYNEVEVVFGGGVPDLETDADSRIRARALGVNALYRPDPGLGFRPYLGAGLAHARVDYQLNEYDSRETLLDDSDSVLAWQMVAGFGVRLSRRVEVITDYRYLRAPDLGFEAADGAEVKTDYGVHSAMISLQYAPWRDAAADTLGGAQTRRGWYLRAQGGMSFAKDAEIKDNVANFDAFDLGPVATLALGRTAGDRWRLELEGVRSRHDAVIIDFNPLVGESRAAGDVRAASLMVNAIFEPRWNLPVRPYVGLGLGTAWADWDVRLRAEDVTYVDDDDRAAAAQLILGAAAAASPRLQLTAEFRYWITDLFDMTQPDGRRLRTDLTVNSLMLGVRYTLR